MRRLFSLICILVVSPVFAQDYAKKIMDNPAMGAANMMNYHYQQTELTPAPKGYSAFYIAHYGRHGSRYDSNDSNVSVVWPIMRKAAESGLLSEAGQAFFKELDAVFTEQEGMYGMLTRLGAREQREIAERMSINFPDVFKSRSGRKTVFAQSSTVPRCIMSMTNFTHSLDRNTEGLDFRFVTGEKYYETLAYRPKGMPAKKMATGKEKEVRRKSMNPLDIIGHFFNDIEKALEIIGDPYSFEQHLYLACCVGHLSDRGTCLLTYFPHEVLVRNWEVRNPRFFLSYGMSDEMSDIQMMVSRRILKDFIERADTALLPGSGIAADLRFGHDTGLLPLVGHLRIEGMDDWAAFDKVNSVWNSSVSICMASNFQMVFYADKKGDVLVKLLYNEKETAIPVLDTFSGPYYKWADLRSYFVSLL